MDYWMLVLWIVLLIVGFALLIKGADWFVDGAAGIAHKCKIPALVIGLTVVAFGTSLPELAASVASAIRSYSDPAVSEIAIGNVAGSNITNILLILGFSALFAKLPVGKSSRVLDLPVLVLASAMLIGLGIWGNAINWWDGLIMLAVFAVYMVLLFVQARRSAKKAGLSVEPTEPEKEPKSKLGKYIARMKEHTWFLVILTVIGLGMVVGGGTLLVNAAQYIASSIPGIDNRTVGLTVVALGTSMPELVTSIVAARKGETDIAVGNVIGSNIFNIFFVAGIASLIYPLPFVIDRNLIDALVALAAALLLCLLSCFDKHRIGRIGGIVMLAAFVGYYVYLFLIPA